MDGRRPQRGCRDGQRKKQKTKRGRLTLRCRCLKSFFSVATYTQQRKHLHTHLNILMKICYAKSRWSFCLKEKHVHAKWYQLLDKIVNCQQCLLSPLNSKGSEPWYDHFWSPRDTSLLNICLMLDNKMHIYFWLKTCPLHLRDSKKFSQEFCSCFQENLTYNRVQEEKDVRMVCKQ